MIVYFIEVNNIYFIGENTYTAEVGGSDNLNSLFLVKVENDEIRKVVKNCGNKRLTDCEGLDMMIVKNIIEFIIEPFTYICNLSLTTGTFPEKMK